MVSHLAYAHPGGDVLFSEVSLRVSGGEHVGLVGANGVGKSTLLRVLAGELTCDEERRPWVGSSATWLRTSGWPMTLGGASAVALPAPLAVRRAGERVLDHEAQLAGGDAAAGMKLGTAIADWSGLGGYELEGHWDAACRRIVRAPFAELADRPAVTLSGGERKRSCSTSLFSSDADVLLLDEPDNFLDVPAKLALERQVKRVQEDGADDLPRPRGPVRCGGVDRHARGQRRLAARRPTHLRPGARGAPTAVGQRREALA